MNDLDNMERSNNSYALLPLIGLFLIAACFVVAGFLSA